MKTYIGTKIVQAAPMILAQAKSEHGVELGKTNTYGDDAEGYLVKYVDGYKSWSPKQVFEDAYREYKEANEKPVCVPTVEDVAEACHNINRAYCQAIGDNSQPTWADAPEWQKSSAINGVKFHLENPNASPSASHDSWLAQKVAEGWIYGEVKDAEKKTHPCCVPYDDLPKEQKAKDYLFKQTVHSFMPFIFQEEPLSPHNTINS